MDCLCYYLLLLFVKKKSDYLRVVLHCNAYVYCFYILQFLLYNAHIKSSRMLH